MAKYEFSNIPNEEAVNFLENKGVSTSFSYKDVWAEEHAFAFTVAKGMEIDIVMDIKNAVTEAISKGQSFKDFQKNLTPILQKKGWWGEKEMIDPKTGEIVKAQLGCPRRLKTIYRTNLDMARASAIWEKAERTKSAMPYLEYNLGTSKEHRKEHKAFEGLILHIDDPFWDKHYPPNGWGCKCSVRQISAFEANKLGGVSKSPKVEYESFTNERTGKKYKVPKGVDPAFSGNAGKAREKGIDKVFNEKFGELPENIVPVVAKDIVRSHRFKMLKEGKVSGTMPVAILPSHMAKLLVEDIERPQRAIMPKNFLSVFFSNYTARKQLKRHENLTIKDYEVVQYLIEHGVQKHLRTHHLMFVGEVSKNRFMKAVVKRSDRGEYFLQTLHRISEEQYKSIIKR